MHTVEVGFFEGAEKLLEVWFNPIPADDPEGLRKIPRERWEELLALVKCTIVSQTSNDFFDSYVLSESSLFVFPEHIILKTCGTTTLLVAVPALLKLAQEEAGVVDVHSLFYSRKNFMNPESQLYPHNSFEDEVHYLDGLFEGSAYTLGCTNGDATWHVYTVEKKVDHHAEELEEENLLDKRREILKGDQTLEVLMTDLDHEATRWFFKGPDCLSAKEVTEASGISSLIPGAITDEISFDPCGYSVNGLLDETYFTIHITPQPECSYASFETNSAESDYTELINKVLKIFRPKNFLITLFTNKHSVCGSSITGFKDEGFEGYRRRAKQYHLFDEYDLAFAHFFATKGSKAIS